MPKMQVTANLVEEFTLKTKNLVKYMQGYSVRGNDRASKRINAAIVKLQECERELEYLAIENPEYQK